tara:strand:- start:680 stop:1003 length:324 start_codon:yes stop_codon:yes gene_type:complete
MEISNGNIAEGYVVPKSDLIEVLENGDVRLFSESPNHIEVDTKETAVACRNTKYNPSAESETVKTSASFTHLTNENNRWNLETGKEQELVITENAEGIVGSSEWEDI